MGGVACEHMGKPGPPRWPQASVQRTEKEGRLGGEVGGPPEQKGPHSVCRAGGLPVLRHLQTHTFTSPTLAAALQALDHVCSPSTLQQVPRSQT